MYPIYKKQFLLFSISFIFFTVFGTISHEYGHIVVAKYFGYATTLNYRSMHYHSDLRSKLSQITGENYGAIKQSEHFDQKEEYERILKRVNYESLWVAMGGPLQTMLTGLIGLILLNLRRKQIKAYGLKFLDWIFVFLLLFWLREIFNLSMSLLGELFLPKGNYFGGDEKKISNLLGLWDGAIPITTGVLGLLISTYVVFFVISKHLRFTFVLSGLLGGISAYIVWFFFLGPIILP